MRSSAWAEREIKTGKYMHGMSCCINHWTFALSFPNAHFPLAVNRKKHRQMITMGARIEEFRHAVARSHCTRASAQNTDESKLIDWKEFIDYRPTGRSRRTELLKKNRPTKNAFLCKRVWITFIQLTAPLLRMVWRRSVHVNTTLSRSNSRRRVAKQFAIEKHLQPSHSQYPIAIYLTSSSFAPDSSDRNNNNSSDVAMRAAWVCQYSIPNAHALNYIESNDVRERERTHHSHHSLCMLCVSA